MGPGFISSTYVAEVLKDLPDAYWRLGEASGTNAADSSGNSHSGTYTNSPTLGVTGVIAGDLDTAVTFGGADGAGTSKCVRVSGVGNYTTGDFSLEFWANASSLVNNPILLFTGAFHTNGYYVQCASNGNMQYSTNQSGFSQSGGAGVGAMVTGVWAHWVFTFQSLGSRIYKNGVQVYGVGGITAPASSANPFSIGNNSSTNAASFNGTIDEVAIYSHALSAQRVQIHYNKGVGK